jgi:hypothetical protein
MPQDELSGPDLAGVVADANAVGLDHVVIGGFSVIFHGYVRATKDSDLLVPDGADADQAVLRLLQRIDAKRGEVQGTMVSEALREGRVLVGP